MRHEGMLWRKSRDGGCDDSFSLSFPFLFALSAFLDSEIPFYSLPHREK